MEVARPQVGGQRDDEGRDEPGACEPAAGRQALTGCLWVLPDECGAGLLVAAGGPHGLRGSQAVILLLCDSRDHWRISTFRAAAGDDGTLRELFSWYAPWLAARLRSVLPAADVEDVLEETFLAVWRGAGGYRPAGAAGGWLRGIARRQAALLLRRADPALLGLPAVIAADGRHSADPAEAASSRAAIAEAVVALGPEGCPHREAWRLPARSAMAARP